MLNFFNINEHQHTLPARKPFSIHYFCSNRCRVMSINFWDNSQDNWTTGPNNGWMSVMVGN